jgi:hypothetical protein
MIEVSEYHWACVPTGCEDLNWIIVGHKVQSQVESKVLKGLWEEYWNAFTPEEREDWYENGEDYLDFVMILCNKNYIVMPAGLSWMKE